MCNLKKILTTHTEGTKISQGKGALTDQLILKIKEFNCNFQRDGFFL